jgi:hypothetical protein
MGKLIEAIQNRCDPRAYESALLVSRNSLIWTIKAVDEADEGFEISNAGAESSAKRTVFKKSNRHDCRGSCGAKLDSVCGKRIFDLVLETQKSDGQTADPIKVGDASGGIEFPVRRSSSVVNIVGVI